jgi:hypothetical protein
VPQYIRPQLDPPEVKLRGIANYLLDAPRVKVVRTRNVHAHAFRMDR